MVYAKTRPAASQKRLINMGLKIFKNINSHLNILPLPLGLTITLPLTVLTLTDTGPLRLTLT